MDGISIDPYYPPIPIPGVSKSLLPGGKQIKNKIYLMILFDVYKKSENL